MFKFLLYLCFAAFSLNTFAQTIVVGNVLNPDGTPVPSGTIEFVPLDTPKTNASGVVFGSKSVSYIDNGRFSVTLYEGLYNCIVGPFNTTKPITIPAGTNVIDFGTLIGDTSNALVTFQQFTTLSNDLAALVTGSVSGVASFNTRVGAVVLETNDISPFLVYMSVVTNGLATTNFVTDSIAAIVIPTTNEFMTGAAITNAAAYQAYLATNGMATGSMDYSVTNHFATTSYVASAISDIEIPSTNGFINAQTGTNIAIKAAQDATNALRTTIITTNLYIKSSTGNGSDIYINNEDDNGMITKGSASISLRDDIDSVTVYGKLVATNDNGYAFDAMADTNWVNSKTAPIVSFSPFVLYTMTNVLSVTNGIVQKLILTNAAQITLSDFDTNNTETIRLEILGSNQVTWITANLSNSAIASLSNYHNIFMLDRPSGTNLWWMYKLIR